MTRRSAAFGIVLIIVCGLVIWTAFGHPPVGPFNNMGFGSDWDCPPNATPASTVCVKRVGPANLQSGAMKRPLGAQFEILVDGKPRSYRDTKAAAMDAAEFIKSRGAQSEVVVKDLKTGEVTAAIFKVIR